MLTHFLSRRRWKSEEGPKTAFQMPRLNGFAIRETQKVKQGCEHARVRAKGWGAFSFCGATDWSQLRNMYLNLLLWQNIDSAEFTRQHTRTHIMENLDSPATFSR